MKTLKIFLILLIAGFVFEATAQRNRSAMIRFYDDYVKADLQDATYGGLDSLQVPSIILPSVSATIWNLAGATQSLTVGTDVAADDGDRHFTEIMIPYTVRLTGIFYLIGSVGGTDSVVVELFDVDGDLVPGATSVASATASGDIVGTGDTFQAIPFTGGTIVVNAGRYYVSAQFDGTTAKYRAPLTTGVPYRAGTEAGTAWTAASITPITTWTVSEGIIGGVY